MTHNEIDTRLGGNDIEDETWLSRQDEGTDSGNIVGGEAFRICPLDGRIAA
jgi:hypothetical protein